MKIDFFTGWSLVIAAANLLCMAVPSQAIQIQLIDDNAVIFEAQSGSEMILA